MLLTQCPACQTAFRLTLDDLAIAAGQVQCGHCQHIFSALEQGAQQSEPGEEPVHESVVGEDIFTEINLDEESLAEIKLEEGSIAEQDFDEVLAAIETQFPAVADPSDSLAAQEHLDSGESDPAQDREADLQSAQAKDFLVTRNRLVGGLLVLLLLVQLAMIFSENLLAHRYIRSGLEGSCQILGCEIPTLIELGSLAIEQSEMTLPDSQQQRRITAVLHNSADIAQPLPNVLLELTDHSGAIIASRLFQPDDYLKESPGTGFVEAGDRLPLSLQVLLAQSNSAVLGYRLQLMLPR